MTDMEERIAAYIAHRLPNAHGVAVDQLSRIPGGSSQETFKFRAVWDEGSGPADRWLILRRAPPAGLVVAERDVEFSVYDAIGDSDVPVPKVYFMEMDPQWLDRPFFVMDMAPGKPGHFWTSDDPFEGQAQAIGERFWRHLGALAAIDHRAVGLEDLRNGSGEPSLWAAELGHWESILDENESMIDPVVRGAIRWLRANPPPPAAKQAIVHGDYRVGNFLFTPDGRISAVLDWEMCHIGDPLEDIAWALNPMWSVERWFPAEEGIALWEQASGLSVDPAALDWWRLFAAVKACAIWTTAEASFNSGRSRDMNVATTAVRGMSFHRKEILDHMAARGAIG
ncbi:MAG TPA: phosphotransferase family protein [Sphingobium sp.]